MLDPFDLVDRLQKIAALLDDGAVRAAIRATQQRIGDALVVDDALRQWEASPQFRELIADARRGVALLRFDAFVESFIRDAAFFSSDTKGDAERVVAMFLVCLEEQLTRRHPAEVILERQKTQTALILDRVQKGPAALLPPVEEEIGSVRGNARGVRTAIRPWILPNIDRTDTLASALRAIRTPGEGAPPVVAIVAAAGYGKTTALAQIFDAIEGSAPFVAFARADDAHFDDASTAEEVHARLAKLAGCSSLTRLAEQHPGGVLLLDTVDLLLTGRSEPLVAPLLRLLAAAGLTVVLTCRDFEFAKALEPVEVRLASLRLVRAALPLFTREESRRAAREFIRALHADAGAEAGEAFADRMMALSADRRPLEEIVRNPLLLAMLCDLFGGEGRIPDDLTTSLLYFTYWERKIASARARVDREAVGQAKVDLCLRMGEALHEASREHLQLFVAEGDLHAAGNAAAEALRELQSEGVLLRTRRGHYGFFHQTLAEFAIAKWLATRDGAAALDRLAARLQTAAGRGELHWWPVVRQLLTLLQPASRAESLVSTIDPSNHFAFRAAALGTAARDDLAGLALLCRQAIGDAENEHHAVSALGGVPTSHHDALYRIAALLVAHGNAQTIKSAMTVFHQTLAAASGDVRAHRVEAMLRLLFRRLRSAGLTRSEFDGLASHLLRRLHACGAGTTERLLRRLRRWYARLSSSSRATIIQLHLHSGTAPEALRHLIERVLTEGPSDELEAAAVALFERVLAIGPPASPWPDVTSMLLERHARPWKAVQARAAGAIAVKSGTTAALLDALLNGPASGVDVDLIALQVAVDAGAAPEVLQRLMERPLASVDERRLRPLTRLISELRRAIAADDAERLLEWMLAAPPSTLAVMVPALAALASVAGRRYDDVLRIYRTLPDRERLGLAGPIAAVSSDRTDPAFIGEIYRDVAAMRSDRARDRALVDLAARGLRLDRSRFLDALIAAAGSENENLASAAGVSIERAAELLLGQPPSRFFPLLLSGFGAVRGNGLEVIRRIVQIHGVSEEDALAIAAHAAREPVNKHRKLILSVFVRWLQTAQSLPPRIFEAHRDRVLALGRRSDVDAGVLREVVLAHALAVELADPAQLTELVEPAKELLMRVDTRQSRRAEPSLRKIVHTLEERLPGFLDAVAADARLLPERNQVMIAVLVKKRRGSQSTLVNQLLRDDAAPLVQAKIRKLLDES